jgi:hypothetical protein
LFPVGLEADKIRNEACGPGADKYELGRCSFGWAFYVSIVCAIGTLINAGLLVVAKVQSEEDEDEPMPSYMI